MLELDAEGERLVNNGDYQDIITKITAMRGNANVMHGDLIQMFVIALLSNRREPLALKILDHFKRHYGDTAYQKRQMLLLAACLGRFTTMCVLFGRRFKYASRIDGRLPNSLLKAAIVGMNRKYVNHFPYLGISFVTWHDDERLRVVKLLIEERFLKKEACPERLLFTSLEHDPRITTTLLDAGLDPRKPVGGKHRPVAQSFVKYLRAHKHLRASVVVLNHIARTTTLFSVMRKRVDLQSSSVPSKGQRQRRHYPRYH